MTPAEVSWAEVYYEMVDYFYWDPRTLGQKKYADSRLKTLDAVMDHIRKIEVTLNHQIKQFLSLAPLSLRNHLFESALGGEVEVPGDLIMAGASADIDRIYQLNNTVQPDFLFISDDTTASLEMKIGAKSSVEQVLKYAFLALAVEQQQDKKMQHILAFLGVGDFSNMFRNNIASVASLKRQIETEKHAYFTKLAGRAKRFQAWESRYFEILESLYIGFISYWSFADLLRSEMPSLDGSPGAEVYRNLTIGMLRELESRGLANCNETLPVANHAVPSLVGTL
jgi:hypothetical protein